MKYTSLARVLRSLEFLLYRGSTGNFFLGAKSCPFRSDLESWNLSLLKLIKNCLYIPS